MPAIATDTLKVRCGNAKKSDRTGIVASLLAGLLGIAGLLVQMPDARAHGERNQEPFLRMRTAHFYDVKWSADKIQVNGELVVSGRFRPDPDWPAHLPKPDVAFLSIGVPGPVMVRTGSWINGVTTIQSTGLDLGRDYEFKMVVRGRIPGRYHVHPVVIAKDSGPLVGPGMWVEVTGNAADFTFPAATLDGVKIDNLEHWGVAAVVKWHLLWIALAVAWVLWWIRRPMLVPRLLALQAGYEDRLITKGDRIFAALLVVGTILMVLGGYLWADAKYPRTVPLQGGRAEVDPLPVDSKRAVTIRVIHATYDVPGRSMKLILAVTNRGDKPVRLGELTTSNLRFVNAAVPQAVAGVDRSYPADLIAKSGLAIDSQSPIPPGETRTLRVEATDVAWELERLTSFMNDPDNRAAGLLFFFTPEGERVIANFSGPVVPVFTNL